MEAQLYDHHHYEEDPRDIGGLQSGEGEKESVLKKVKDKAKKIKDTIKKHGHEHDYRHDQISEEEDDDDDDHDDMVNVSEVHGVPMYESPVIPGTSLPIQTDVNLENPTSSQEDRRRDDVYPNLVDDEISMPSIPGRMGTELQRSLLQARRPVSEDLPQSRLGATFVGETKPTVESYPLIGLEEDPHSPKSHPGKLQSSNYQCKVTDPTGEGGKEAEVGPLLERLGNFHIHDQSTPAVGQFTPTNPVDPSKNPGSPERSMESMPRDTIAGKLSSATSVITDKALSAKDMVASKLGYGGQHQYGDVSSDKLVSELAAEYRPRVGEEVAGPGSTAISEIQGGREAQGGGKAAKGTVNTSVKDYVAEKLRPGEEDKELSEAIAQRFYYKKKEGTRRTEEEARAMEPEGVFGTAKDASGGSERSGGVVNRLKGAVGSWFGKSTETRSA